MIGQTISHYKIIEKLGEGGMGVVWKAEDTKLERTVALKFLAEHLLSDTEAKQRFLREAKAAAALSHPNICTVHEIDEAQGKTFLAMELVEGETLEDRIAKGPLPIKDALDIGRQLADGLEAAHEKGIVHRDIKPANVLLDAKGRATIMDFGLARLTEASRLTRADTTMGTVAYMSPEQVQGMEVDHRSDIWALGVVLYEMVTGLRPFKGQYDQALAYEIVQQEPEPLTGVRAGVPMELELMTSKCLAKDAADRYQHASEAAVDLRTLGDKLKSGRSTILGAAVSLRGSPQVTTASELAHYRVVEDLGEREDSRVLRAEDVARKRTVSIRIVPEAIAVAQDRRRMLMRHAVGVLAALFVFASGIAVWLAFKGTTPQAPTRVRRFALPLSGTVRSVEIAPDGSAVAYIDHQDQLWVQDFEQDEPRLLASGVGLLGRYPLTWSVDSKTLAYAADNSVMTIRAEGGPPATLHSLAEARRVADLAWSSSGDRLYYALEGRDPESRGVYSLSSRGGTPELIFKHGHPHDVLSPDGERFVSLEAVGSGESEHQIVVKGADLAGVTLPTPSVVPRSLAYDPQGFLLFAVSQDGASMIWALPFSMETMQSLGEAFPVVRGANPSASADGTLVYQSSGSTGKTQLRWFDRGGRRLGAIGLPQDRINYPNLSPDGRQVAAVAVDSGSTDVWVHEVERPVKIRVTADERRKTFAVWEPSGQQISYTAMSDETALDLWIKRADGKGNEVLLSGEPQNENGHYWSPEGTYLAYLAGPPFEVYYRAREADGSMGEQVPFLTTQFSERIGPFSPDGHWVLYSSNETGDFEVYVCRFPEGDSRTQVSIGGGTQPRWRADGKEVFFVRDDTLMAATIMLGESVRVGEQAELFEHSGLVHGGTVAQYDVAADGQRFVIRDSAVSDQEPPVVRIVENWYEEFRDRGQD